MKDSNRAVGFDWQNDDVRLHEPLRRLKRERQRLGGFCNWRDRRLQLVDAHRGWYRPNTRGAREGYVRWLVTRQLRIVALVDRADPLANCVRQLRQNKDAIDQASLAVKSTVRSEFKIKRG